MKGRAWGQRVKKVENDPKWVSGQCPCNQAICPANLVLQKLDLTLPGKTGTEGPVLPVAAFWGDNAQVLEKDLLGL